MKNLLKKSLVYLALMVIFHWHMSSVKKLHHVNFTMQNRILDTSVNSNEQIRLYLCCM